ncbi:XRE family transcriptional regulator [Umezawaea endophytica]|uniref:XRE family transcriptional regulator n=1 Tax=Umezawaea endophytica TaxID=1654476 RepID=A0A9X2VPY6_9PSEU|nr:XRE family transcriptional regulator [Umezawaea endophytica]
MVAERQEPRSLTERLDRLFRTVHPANRGEYTYEEVASAIREQGTMISHTYVWQLRKGIRDNPTKRHLEALASFFGVPASYFLDDDTSAADAQLELLATLRDDPVRSLALRAAELSPNGLAAIRAMVEHARSVEGLPSEET